MFFQFFAATEVIVKVGKVGKALGFSVAKTGPVSSGQTCSPWPASRKVTKMLMPQMPQMPQADSATSASFTTTAAVAVATMATMAILVLAKAFRAFVATPM